MARLLQNIRSFLGAFRASKPGAWVSGADKPLSDAEYKIAVEVEKHAQGKGMGSG